MYAIVNHLVAARLLVPSAGEEVTDEISDSANSFADGVADALPRIGVALAVTVVGYVVVRVARRLLYRNFRRRNTESFARVMSKLIGWLILGMIVLSAITITFPSVKPVDLLAGLGFFSVAVGFAFQDILENSLSGVLLLFRQPFRAGDQILVDGNEGTVEAITIRETRMRQYDGQLLVVPNRDVYKNAIRVQTDQPARRIEFTVGVAYEEDLDEVRLLIVDGLDAIPGLRSEPPPEALVRQLAPSTVDIDVRGWVDSRQHDSLVVLDAMIRATKRTLDEAGVELPCEIIALRATSSFRAAVHDRGVTPAGGPAARP